MKSVAAEGTCTHCGYRGPLDNTLHPIRHGELRMKGTLRHAPGVCYGVNHPAENIHAPNRVRRRQADLASPNPMPAEPAVLSRMQGEVLSAIAGGQLYFSASGTPMIKRRHSAYRTSADALADTIRFGWAEKPSNGRHQLTERGEAALQRYRTERNRRARLTKSKDLP